MVKLNWSFDEASGIHSASFGAKLVAPLSEKVFENSNGTKYKLATIEAFGKKLTAMIYEGNFNYGVEVGKEYTCKAVYDPSYGSENVLITMSHLEPLGGRITASELGLEFEEDEVTEESSIEREVKA